MINPSKVQRAEAVVANPSRFEPESAERVLYERAKSEEVKDLVQYIYTGLGGELATEEKVERVTKARAKIAKKNSKK